MGFISSRLRLTALGTAFLGTGLWLSGCGGGSSSISGGTTRAALTGVVRVPAGAGRAATRAGELVPVADGKVDLIRLADGQTVDTDTTDSTGKFEFNSVGVGENYEIRCTKETGGGTLTVRAIVTADTDENTEDTRDLDPDTTVAAQAVIAQQETLKNADPNSHPDDLQSIAEEMEKKRKELQSPPPDLTKPEEVNSASETLINQNAPDGSYAGSFTGDNGGGLAALIKDGKFVIMALPDSDGAAGGGTSKAARAIRKLTRGADGPAATPDQSPRDHDFVFGNVSVDGVVSATGHDVRISGLFSGGVGTGTWKTSDGKSGTWSLSQLKHPLAGFYAGFFNSTHATQGPGETPPAPPTRSEGGNGRFAILILDDLTAYVAGGDASEPTRVVGTGSADSDGKVQFTVKTPSGETIQGTGQVHGNSVSGTFQSANGSGEWRATRNSADANSLLNGNF